jgi:hypothetical protein
VSRSEYKAWLAPNGAGHWSLYTFFVVVVKPWLEPMSIDQIVEERPFKVAIDSKKRLSITALLAW